MRNRIGRSKWPAGQGQINEGNGGDGLGDFLFQVFKLPVVLLQKPYCHRTLMSWMGI